ncbi:ribonuclease T2 family protein [Novosphingobium guangzhouense]|uniref:Ribonuclease T n=1 Tax=Novosphingobium guangzhouense TaxID=1850347 RepID=A0A2K2FSA4_9SPHN|nr:ribonuclease T [Novosphingobium guangzhouense]PNU01666.1 ribonuclease T [Novosphingobium guangzhouense]
MKSAAALIAALALLPAQAWAQAYQCSVPRTIAPVRPLTPDGPVRRTTIAGYTLAASWSPDYCKTSGDARSMQCNPAHGRFGFILHGLWPEAARGPAPQWCATQPVPTPQILRENLCMTPSPGLLAHEWAKHGSCMVATPQKYFRVSAILWRSIHWPDADRLSRKKGLTVGHLREEFVAANPGWPHEAVGVEISRTGWLREVQLCYGKDFRPAHCPARQYGPADSAALKIWRGL